MMIKSGNISSHNLLQHYISQYDACDPFTLCLLRNFESFYEIFNSGIIFLYFRAETGLIDHCTESLLPQPGWNIVQYGA